MSEPSRFVEAKIEDVAFGGDGVARHEGKVVFIPFTADGDKVRARVVRQKKKFVQAELDSVLEPSPWRVEPECPYFQDCGGCSYQHIAYAHQLEIKQRQVEETLRRVGRLPGTIPMRAIVPSPKQYAYRNRIRMHVESGRAGFYAHRSHELVDIERCPIASTEVNDALRNLRGRAVFDGDYTLSENAGGRFFEQTNSGVADELLALVEKLIPSGVTLVDAYCGAGFFARHFVTRFQNIIGIEENEAAVDYARRDAMPHERYIAGDVEVHLAATLSGNADDITLILDPPATGITARVCDAILASAPRQVIYVSCNPATLARDLGILTRTYELLSVTPLDMFPQTAEIEAVAHLQKPKP